MASFQARERDPLLDQGTQAALERRGKELLGLALIAAGIAVAAMLGSYSPDDPNWLAATDAPAGNALGRIGAAIAAPLFVIAGHAAWGLAVLFAGWGLRFVLHRGSDRALARAVFAPIAVALAAVHASTLVPGADWEHSFGLGGLFGDTVLGALLGILPVSAGFGLKALSVLSFAATLVMGAFVMGFEKGELRALWRFLWQGAVLLYATVLALALRAGGAAAAGIGRAAAPRTAAAARCVEPGLTAAPAEAGPRRGLLCADPKPGAAAVAGEATAPRARAGLLASLRRVIEPAAAEALEPELVDRALPGGGAGIAQPSDDRVRARIADAVRARLGGADHAAAGLRAEPPVTGGPTLPQPGRMAVDLLADGPEDDEAEAEELALVRLPGETAEEPRQIVQPPVRRAPAPSKQARDEAQPRLRFDEPAGPGYEHPPLALLESPETITRHQLSHEALEANARMLEAVLDDYGVKGEIVSVRPGPVVTLYELEPAPGLKASRVIGLADDIARSMSALSARVSTVPGRSVIGIELPNAHREKVLLREILAARDFGDTNQRLPLALGKDIAGEAIVANLAKMPHLLIAGTTGSGKSVAINTMILSLLYKLSPEECRLIMIDPKMLELSVYDGIPHLLSPVVTDPKKAVVALKWVVGEMEERYRKMSKMGVRNIEGYNGRVREALAKGEMFKRTVQTGFDEETGDPVFETEEFQPRALPYIVVIVDEMADLMMVAGKEIEACIQRLAQMARASGIHLIMATQRPSVDVITGTIKANFPTRISFQVTSKIDSRTILGEMGAEQLLGMGDMLYMAGGSKITRIHGPFVSDEEVEEIVTHLKSFGPPEYVGGVVEGPDEDKEADIDMVLGLGGNTDGEDALYDQAVAVVLKDRKVSTSYIQRKLGIGYNKAARLVEQMEEQGLVSPANHVGKREILVPEQ